MLFTFTDFHIFTVIFIYSSLHGFTWNQNCDQLLVGFLAQLVEHSTGIVEVMSSYPVQDRTEFFQSLFCSEKKIAFILMSYAYYGFTNIAQSFTWVSVKFPHSPILHCAFSSWIEKTMTKTIHCHWENRFVLQ